MPFKAGPDPSACAFALRPNLTSATLIVAATAFFSTSAVAQTASRPAITINGAGVSASEAERNNHVFVPAQSVFSRLGEVVTYRASQAVVKTKSGVELARMTLGSREASVKGAAQTLAAAPFTARGDLMVPLRFVSEAAGATVAYSASPRAISIRNEVPVATAPAAVVSQTNPASQATDAVAATPAHADSGGLPWWVWLLAALAIIGLILAFSRRKKEPLITTSRKGRGGDPTITTRH